MRISDWSSDVCSSDLIGDPARALRLLPNPDGLQELNAPAGEHAPRQRNRRHEFAAQGMAVLGQRRLAVRRDQVGPVAERRDGVAGPRRRIVMKIGRGSCRERVGQYGEISGVAGSFKNKKKEKVT